MRLSKKQITEFQNFIFDWWKSNRRDLPWRHTNDPYHILVSEVMLQQTQVSRVLPKYDEFLYTFPTVHMLAKASPAKVLRLWKGMGYNRRALFLKKTAEAVIHTYNGIFPVDEKSLLTLPGVGSYTSRAIMVFAYRKDVAMVDTNIRQIITRHFFDGVPQKEKIIAEIAEQLVPKGKSWEWHQALMDYGAASKFERRNLEPVEGWSKKKTIPFHDSNRFFRGRIMDLLREKSMKERDVLDIMKEVYMKEKECIMPILQKLEKDGLIVRSKIGIITLPE